MLRINKEEIEKMIGRRNNEGKAFAFMSMLSCLPMQI